MEKVKDKLKVLIASTSFEDEPEAYEVLKDANFQIINKTKKDRENWTEEDLVRELKNVDAAILGGDYDISSTVIENVDGLRAISLNCTGYNHVDIKSATKKGIIVSNVHGRSYNAVADFIFGLILCLMRQILKGNRIMLSGKWNKGVGKSPEVSCKTIGIIGMGSIGQAVARRAIGFDMKIIYNVRNPKKSLEEKYGLTFVSKDELLEQSDIVVLCCPLTEETYHLIGKDELKKMKKESYIINTARGPIIDEDALYEALCEKVIAGAALDVFDVEPVYESKFFGIENVILTPHMAGLADRQILECAVGASENLVKVLKGKKIENIINPEVLK